MLKEVFMKEDPLDDHIRIKSKWKRDDDLEFDQKMLNVADGIAGHIKKIFGS